MGKLSLAPSFPASALCLPAPGSQGREPGQGAETLEVPGSRGTNPEEGSHRNKGGVSPRKGSGQTRAGRSHACYLWRQKLGGQAVHAPLCWDPRAPMLALGTSRLGKQMRGARGAGARAEGTCAGCGCRQRAGAAEPGQSARPTDAAVRRRRSHPTEGRRVRAAHRCRSRVGARKAARGFPVPGVANGRGGHN